jgi:hypothetical protein
MFSVALISFKFLLSCLLNGAENNSLARITAGANETIVLPQGAKSRENNSGRSS